MSFTLFVFMFFVVLSFCLTTFITIRITYILSLCLTTFIIIWITYILPFCLANFMLVWKVYILFLCLFVVLLFLIGKVYIRLKSIYFVLLLVCYFAFLINNKTYRQIEFSTWLQNEFSEEWRKWLVNIMYKGIEKWRRKCGASCTFIRIFFKSAHKGYLPTKVGEISSQLRY